MSEKYTFKEIEENCKKIITFEVNDLLKGKSFIMNDCNFFIRKLKERIGEKIKKNSANFKYIINIIMLDNSKNGFVQDFEAYYNDKTDGIISMHFPFEKISCIVNLICLSL